MFLCLFSEVLTVMAHHLQPNEFLDLLPSNGDWLFFFPFVRLCLGVNQSVKMKTTVMDLGHELQNKC